jgi:hypothetical protein
MFGASVAAIDAEITAALTASASGTQKTARL